MKTSQTFVTASPTQIHHANLRHHLISEVLSKSETSSYALVPLALLVTILQNKPRNITTGKGRLRISGRCPLRIMTAFLTTTSTNLFSIPNIQ